MRRAPSLAMALAAAVTVSLCPRPGLAAVDAAPSFEQFAQAWMGAVALLAHDGGERDHGDRDAGGARRRERGGDRERGGHERADVERHGGRGAAGPGPGPRLVAAGPQAAVAKMDEILARLARIEAKLDGRGVMPARMEFRGPMPPAGGRGPRPEMPEQARRMMEERMRRATEGMSPEDRARIEERMKAARERMREGGGRPEGRPALPEAARERMDQARQAFRQMEERIRKLEAEIERLKADR